MTNTRAFGPSSTADEVLEGIDLTGKKAIVTGASSGIGVDTATALARAGARVVMAVRDLAAGHRVADEAGSLRGKLEVDELDLGVEQSIRAFAARHADEPLSILINNAGVMATPQGSLGNGLETQIGTNHFGHFLLATLLHKALRSGAPARIVALTSLAHVQSPMHFDDIHFDKRPYDKWQSYAQSKTANVLFAVEATRRWGQDGITANAAMPGGIMTNLQREMPREEMIAMGFIDEAGTPHPMFKSAAQGAATSVWAATAPELSGKGGLYLEDCAVSAPWKAENPYAGYAPHAVDPEAATRLWSVSESAFA